MHILGASWCAAIASSQNCSMALQMITWEFIQKRPNQLAANKELIRFRLFEQPTPHNLDKNIWVVWLVVRYYGFTLAQRWWALYKYRGRMMTYNTSNVIIATGITLFVRSRFAYGRKPLRKTFTDDYANYTDDRLFQRYTHTYTCTCTCTFTPALPA